MILTAWCRDLPEQLTGLQLVKKFPRHFTEPEGSLQHSQASATRPYPGLYKPINALDHYGNCVPHAQRLETLYFITQFISLFMCYVWISGQTPFISL